MEPGFVLLLALCLLLKSVTADDPSGSRCPSASGREETCVCQADGGIIDLTPYSNTDGTPRYSLAQLYSMVMVQYIMYSLVSILCCMCRYTDLPDAQNRYSYAYNPCKAYQDSQNKGDCDNIYVSAGMIHAHCNVYLIPRSGFDIAFSCKIMLWK